MLNRELPVASFDLNLTSTEYMHHFLDSWYPMAGVRELALMMDLRTIWVPQGGPTVYVVPAMQFAVARRDRPDTSIEISGTARSTVDLWKYVESLSSYPGKAFFRVGLAAKLGSAGAARVHTLLHCAYRQMARVFPAQEIVVNPTNDNSSVLFYPLCGQRPVPTVGVDKAVFVTIGMGNDTGATTVYQFYARAFNDPLARGNWTAIGSTSTPNAVNFADNTQEISLSGLSLGNYQWVEFALGVWRTAGNATRCIFHVIPAVTFV